VTGDTRDPQADAADPLARRFYGKRRQTRQPVRLLLECSHRGRTFRGATVDLSPGGMLVEVLDVEGLDLEASDGQSMLESVYPVLVEFAEGMQVRFTAAGVETQAKIVRIALQPERSEHLLLGCAFEKSLDADECARLSLDRQGDDETARNGAAEVADHGDRHPAKTSGHRRTARKSRRLRSRLLPPDPADFERTRESR
jgi:hypothetical protein